MRLIRGLSNLKPYKEGCILTIGNYDGIHLGHQKILQSLVARAKSQNLKAIVFTFSRRPREHFGKCSSSRRLMTLREKITKFIEIGIDAVIFAKFDDSLAQMSAENFILNILVSKLNIKEIFIGDDFRFGYGRLGNLKLLRDYAHKYDFIVNVINEVLVDGVRVSSTLLRHYIEKGDLQKIKTLLGRDFRIVGRVIHGDEIGKKLGFPTANINMHNRIILAPGVYIVQVIGLNNTLFNGVANIGFRPTLNNKRCLLEVHLFDFNENIYGKIIEVIFLHKLRVEKKFDSLLLLKQQIEKDVAQAKKYFDIVTK